MPPKLEVKIIRRELLQHEFIYLLPLGDLHIDEPQSDIDALRGYVAWVKAHRNAYILGMGDWFTAPTKDSKASVYELVEDWKELGRAPMLIDEAEDLLVDIFAPVADQLAAACIGGHEFNHCFRVCGHDPMRSVMKRLGVEASYSRDGGALLLKTAQLGEKDNLFFVIVYTHGWGTARTRGAKISKLERLSSGLEADCFVMAHDHLQNLTRDNYLHIPSFDSQGWSVHRKLLVNAGSFRGYAGYPFRSGYPPADLGTPRIRIGKRTDEEGNVRKDLHASI
jgi:hypothetical protein